MPATCVPWKETWGSTASDDRLSAPAPTNARATMIFGVVHFVPPFGKPDGYEKPCGEKNGLSGSIPSSTTAIFMPAPDAIPAAAIASAPIRPGLRLVESMKRRLG